MAETWIVRRMRIAFLRENMLLIVLKLLREGEKGEWEVLSALDSRFGLTPSAKEFRKVEETLVGGGYARLERPDGSRVLRMTDVGAALLGRLEEEYRAVVSGYDPSPGALVKRTLS